MTSPCRIYLLGEHNTSINKNCGSRIGLDRGIIEGKYNRRILEHDPPRPMEDSQSREDRPCAGTY